jgi:hypothetical protein
MESNNRRQICIAEPKRKKIYLFTRPSVGQIATKEIPQVFLVSSAVEMLLLILSSIMRRRELCLCSYLHLCRGLLFKIIIRNLGRVLGDWEVKNRVELYLYSL